MSPYIEVITLIKMSVSFASMNHAYLKILKCCFLFLYSHITEYQYIRARVRVLGKKKKSLISYRLCSLTSLH